MVEMKTQYLQSICLEGEEEVRHGGMVGVRMQRGSWKQGLWGCAQGA